MQIFPLLVSYGLHLFVFCLMSSKKSERPVDALALKTVNYPLTYNLESRDASASKNPLGRDWGYNLPLPRVWRTCHTCSHSQHASLVCWGGSPGSHRAFNYFSFGTSLDAYIKHGYLWKVPKGVPFSSQILHRPHNDNMFQLMVVEVGSSEGHHQVPQTDQGAVRVGKQTNNHMTG